jgi:hypothetical protein
MKSEPSASKRSHRGGEKPASMERKQEGASMAWRLGAVVSAIVLCANTSSQGVRATPILFAGETPAIKIDLARGSEREQKTKETLEQVLATYDLKKYTFTRHVVIEERAINHAFPVLTLNARFASSPDELLSSYVHEQLHWHLRDQASQQQAAVAELRRMYPGAPVGLPEGAESAYSTYGHLVDCYLEIIADRELMGTERTAATIADKGHYTWIYATVLHDERRIADVVDRHHLRLK